MREDDQQQSLNQLLERKKKSQQYFCLWHSSRITENQDIENVTEILNAREKSAEYLSSP